MAFIGRVIANFILCGIFSGLIYFIIFVFGGNPSYVPIFWTVFIINGIIGMINYGTRNSRYY